MRILIDTDARTLSVEENGSRTEMPLYTPDAFSVLSRQWVRVGWSQKYSYTFTWLGRPIIQMPEDMVRVQEIIWAVKPDVIIETGVARGGSLIFYATLCKTVGHGRVVGVDIEIRPANRAAILEHPLASYVTLIEGSSIDPTVIERVRAEVRPDDRVLVLLDSCHTKAHVLAELEAYAPLVSPGSYIVATDGIMGDLHDVPGGRREWAADNPAEAAREFARSHPEFVLEQPQWRFSESALTDNVTHWPSAWLRRTG